MTEQLTRAAISRMIAGASALVRQQHAWLSDLDSRNGDGDHGATMLRTMSCLEKAFADDARDIRESFHQAGWNVLGADGGASSSLLGAFFLGMAEAPGQGMTILDCAGLANAFEAGLREVEKYTGARVGDKTMLDALIPAVGAFSAAARTGQSVETALHAAAQAARAGADATKELTARYGRARLLGEKTRGYQDPGSVSIALIFEGFYQGLTAVKGEVSNA